MTVTADAATYDFGDTAVLTITGHSETPNEALVNGIAETLQGASSSGGNLILPPGTDFEADANHQYTPILQDIPVTLKFPTEADDTVLIQIVPEDPYFYETAGAGPYDSTSVFPTGTQSGDVFKYRVTSGTLSSVSGGVITASAVPLVVEVTRYPLSLEMWSAADEYTYQLTSYPDVPMNRPTIVPMGLGRYVYPTVSGGVRVVDMGEDDVFDITVVQPLLTQAQRDSIYTFYENTKDNIQLTTGGQTYSCSFKKRPQERAPSRAPTRFDVISRLTGTLT